MNGAALAVIVLFLSGLLPAHSAERATTELRQRYASATSEMQRVQVAMDAMSAKIICRGCSVDAVDQIFATDFQHKDPNSLGFDDKYSGAIYFAPPADLNQRNASPERALAYKGWYLGIKFDKNGELVNYYLTNIHK